MKIICLGAGHGGRDPGAHNGKRRERDDNLKLSLAVGKYLETQGHKVVLTRVNDSSMAPDQRRQVAINCKADIYIDIHGNSFTDGTAKGIEIWIRDTEYAQSACEILERLAKIPNQGNRGVKIGNFAVLYDMPMPAMLLELGFISNTADNELYDKHFDANAKAISEGILCSLGTKNAEPSRQYARIQLGAYPYPDNEAGARRDLARIRAMGIDAFLVIPSPVKERE